MASSRAPLNRDTGVSFPIVPLQVWQIETPYRSASPCVGECWRGGVFSLFFALPEVGQAVPPPPPPPSLGWAQFSEGALRGNTTNTTLAGLGL